MKNLFQKKSNRRILLVIGVLAALFVVFDYIVMPLYVDHEATMEVPDVTGLTLEEARMRLVDARLEPIEADTRPDPKAPPGTVVGQNPDSGAYVKQGRRVYLSVSGGELVVMVPKLRGLSARDARFALDRVGLRVGRLEYALSDTFFQNTIIDQSVPPGVDLARGEVVHLVVSRGKNRSNVIVPDLIGKTVAEAEKLLAGEGLTVGRVTFQSGINLIPNTIVEQFPRAGESIGDSTGVDLFVVKLGTDSGESERPEY